MNQNNLPTDVPKSKILTVAFVMGLILWGLIFGLGRTMLRSAYPQVGEPFIPGLSYWTETVVLILAGALFNTLLYYVNRVKLNRYK